MTDLQNRKRIKHKDIPGHARELTFSCFERKPLLSDDGVCALLGEAIGRACQRHDWLVIAFVFMPEHVHLLVRKPRDDPHNPPEIAAFLKAIKQPTSFRYRRMMQAKGIDHPLWLAGPGYDRNIMMMQTLRASIDYIHANPVRRGLCSTPGDWIWSSWKQWYEPEAVLSHASIPRVNHDW